MYWKGAKGVMSEEKSLSEEGLQDLIKRSGLTEEEIWDMYINTWIEVRKQERNKPEVINKTVEHMAEALGIEIDDSKALYALLIQKNF